MIWSHPFTTPILTSFAIATMVLLDGFLTAFMAVTLCGMWYCAGKRAAHLEEIEFLKKLKKMGKQDV